MDKRFSFVEVKKFIKNVREDYKKHSDKFSKEDKKSCWNGIIINLLKYVWSAISAPFIYPMWYIFRKPITENVYKGTSWEEVESLMDSNQTKLAKEKLQKNGLFLYWLWTYGDAHDPLGRGGLPEKFGENTFWNRFKYSAIRNARFNINYMDFRTGLIKEIETIIDERNFNYMHKSTGLGDSPDGIYFKWMRDTDGKCYFIYEDNNKNCIFYFGYVGFLYQDIGKGGGRFETAYRKTDSSYIKDSD